MLLVLLFAEMTNAQIKLCNESDVIGSGVILCSNEDYDKGLVGSRGHAAMLEEKITMYDIPEFNPEDKTVTIFMMLMVYWNDTRVTLKTSDHK